MDTRSEQKYIDSEINTAIAQKVASRNESTREGSYDSLLEITNDEVSIKTDQTKKISRQEYMNSIVEAAIAKTVTDEKEKKRVFLKSLRTLWLGKEKEKRKKMKFQK